MMFKDCVLKPAANVGFRVDNALIYKAYPYEQVEPLSCSGANIHAQNSTEE